MNQDYETSNYIGAGEHSAFSILKHLTKLHQRSLKEFPKSGIYKQVPIDWLIPKKEYDMLSEAHKKGSIDIFILFNQIRIAVRVQGKGHGEGLKGLGKAKHDDVQEQILKQYCEVVNIERRECPNVFKERVNGLAINEIISSFKTAKVMIPVG